MDDLQKRKAELQRRRSTLQDVTLGWYKDEFDQWLIDFKQTEDYKEDCMTHRELHQKFKEMVWNPIKLACGCPEEGPFRWWSPTLPKKGSIKEIKENIKKEMNQRMNKNNAT